MEKNVRWALAKSALAVVGMMLASSAANADTWRGTAPFCDGECLANEVEVQRSNAGNGGTCWSGTKVLCRNKEPTCYAEETRTSCKALVLMCETGYYSYTPLETWHSCSKFACGACVGADF